MQRAVSTRCMAFPFKPMDSTKAYSQAPTSRARDNRDLVFFAHAALDDLGLRPCEFRIYCRLARRAGTGEAWESVGNLAKGCEMSERQTQYALKLLVAAKLVDAETRPGKTTVFTLNPTKQWAHPDQIPRLRSQVSNKSCCLEGGAPPAGEGCTTCTPGGAPDAPKVDPIEVDPIKEFKKNAREEKDELVENPEYRAWVKQGIEHFKHPPKGPYKEIVFRNELEKQVNQEIFLRLKDSQVGGQCSAAPTPSVEKVVFDHFKSQLGLNQAKWRLFPQQRSQVVKWVETQPGVTIGVDGPVERIQYPAVSVNGN